MATLIIDGAKVAASLDEALAAAGSEAEMTLDFSSVLRIDPAALHAIEELAAAADASSVKVTLQSVNVDVYKVLKLMHLASRFSFGN